MAPLTSNEISSFFLAIGVLLSGAKICGYLAQRWHQPAIVGELLAGIILGPSLFGAINGGWASAVIPLHTGRVPVLWDSLTTFCVTMFLLVAGMEVNLSRMLRHTKGVVGVSATSMLFPLTLGFGVAWAFPSVLARPQGVGPIFFALFFGTALAISALPVIAKTLFDLKLYESDAGTVIIAAAIVNDLSGWILFGILVAMTHGATLQHASGAIRAVLLTLTFAIVTLTLGRGFVDLALHRLRDSALSAGSVLALIPVLGLFGGAISEAIGIHAIFGAFLVGVAVGNSSALADQDRTTIIRFVTAVFAPLFFVSLGLKVNFISNFDLQLVAIVLGIACLGKVAGAKLGAMAARMPSRDGWAVALGLNSRGAMEIVLATLLLQRRFIAAKLFVALVLMALVTSMISGPAIQGILGLRRQVEDRPLGERATYPAKTPT